MPSPFPGMDPYLETPDLWPDVHHELISGIRSMLNPALRPHYIARVELRVYVSDDDDPGREAIIPNVRIEKPKTRNGKSSKVDFGAKVALAEPVIVPFLIDDEIEEAYLAIRRRETGGLVTVIEVLSPTNKIRGSRGRASFMKKRRETLISEVHWVEIDLLRAGLATVNRKRVDESDYRIVVSRGDQRAQSCVWPFSVRQRFPLFGVPLLGKDPDVPVDLNAVLATGYENAAYDVSIDYREEPDPPLTGGDKAWADKLLRKRSLR